MGSLQQLDSALCCWLQNVFPPRNIHRSANSESQNRQHPPTIQQNNTRSRAATYKKIKDLFVKKRPDLANKILEGKPLLQPETLPEITAIEHLYRNLFESPSPSDEAPVQPSENADTYHPIKELELLLAGETPHQVLTGSRWKV